MDYVIKSYFLSKNKKGTLYHTFLGVIIWSNISCMHANKMGVNTPITSSHCIAGPSASTSEDNMLPIEEIEEVKTIISCMQDSLVVLKRVQDKHSGNGKMKVLVDKTISMLRLIVSDGGSTFRDKKIKEQVQEIRTGIRNLKCDNKNQYIPELECILEDRSIRTEYCLELANRNLGYIQIEIDRFSTIDDLISIAIERAKALINEAETLLRNNSYKVFQASRDHFVEQYTELYKLLESLEPEAIGSSCKTEAAQTGKVFADKIIAQAHQKTLERFNSEAIEKKIETRKKEVYAEKYKKFQLINEMNAERKAENRQVIQVNEAAQEKESIERLESVQEKLSQDLKIESARAAQERMERHIKKALERCRNEKNQSKFQKLRKSLISDLNKEKEKMEKTGGNQLEIDNIERYLNDVSKLSFK